MAIPSYKLIVGQNQAFDRPLRVLLDARKWQDGGIGSFISSAIFGLANRAEINLSVLITPDSVTSFADKFSAATQGKISILTFAASGYSIKDYLRLNAAVNWSDFDLFHSPHYTLPFNIPVKKVVTIHDLIHITHPEHSAYPLIARLLISSSIKRADRVTTVSRASGENIANYFAKNPSEISVLQNCLGSELSSFSQEETLAYRKDNNRILCVIPGLKPHKGLEDFLNVIAELQQEASISKKHETALDQKINSLKFTIVGKGAEQLLNNKKTKSLLTGLRNIQVLGFVSTEELAKLYRESGAVVLPSLEEGFGLPLLEAHAFGTPVIARPVAAFKEISLRGDIFARDFSLAALRDALVYYLESESSLNREEFVEHCKMQMRDYSIQEFTEKLVACYLEVAEDTDAKITKALNVEQEESCKIPAVAMAFGAI